MHMLVHPDARLDHLMHIDICIRWSNLYLAMLYRNVIRDTIASGSRSSSAAIRPEVLVHTYPVSSSCAMLSNG